MKNILSVILIIVGTILATSAVWHVGLTVAEHCNRTDQAFVLSVQNREFINSLVVWLETQGVTVQKGEQKNGFVPTVGLKPVPRDIPPGRTNAIGSEGGEGLAPGATRGNLVRPLESPEADEQEGMGDL